LSLRLQLLKLMTSVLHQRCCCCCCLQEAQTGPKWTPLVGALLLLLSLLLQV
jgi:hypothetical protein